MHWDKFLIRSFSINPICNAYVWYLSLLSIWIALSKGYDCFAPILFYRKEVVLGRKKHLLMTAFHWKGFITLALFLLMLITMCCKLQYRNRFWTFWTSVLRWVRIKRVLFLSTNFKYNPFRKLRLWATYFLSLSFLSISHKILCSMKICWQLRSRLIFP